jgi:hypothetical protein
MIVSFQKYLAQMTFCPDPISKITRHLCGGMLAADKPKKYKPKFTNHNFVYKFQA